MPPIEVHGQDLEASAAPALAPGRRLTRPQGNLHLSTCTARRRRRDAPRSGCLGPARRHGPTASPQRQYPCRPRGQRRLQAARPSTRQRHRRGPRLPRCPGRVRPATRAGLGSAPP
eukprot:9535413-Alexandrium_andersonii.AAC.1